MDISNRILLTAAALFTRYGIKSVTMDDVAAELGISKKTIYQHFADKDEIVYQVVQLELEKDQCEYEELDKVSENTIEKIMRSADMMRVQFAAMNPSLIFDVKKYHPRAWRIFQEHKQKFLLESIRQDLLRGIQEGLFRPDLNVEILSRLRMEEIEMGFDYQLFPPDKFNLLDIQLVFLDHFIRGILSEHGVVIYESYLYKQLVK